MQSFSEFIENQDNPYDKIPDEVYEMLIDEAFLGTPLNEAFIGDALKKAKAKMGKAKKLFKDLKTTIAPVLDEFGIEVSKFVEGLKNKDVLSVLKFFKFSLKSVFKGLKKAGDLWIGTLRRVFKEIHDTKVVQKIKEGTMKVDEVLDRWPILKKLTGPIIAGVLIYIWLNMSFSGNLDFDVDISSIFKALTGSFNITDLFLSQDGLLMLGLLMTGGIASFPWLGVQSANILLALAYTIYKHAPNSSLETLNALKAKIR